MINKQPIEKREPSYEGTLQVHSIFKTIQGEGPFCGTPCVFVRLAGCNLQCPACDTDYTSTRNHMDVNSIVARVHDLSIRQEPRGLVVITGGEPFRQHIGELVSVLVECGWYVQIESNGTMNPPVFPWNKDTSQRRGAYIVISPKTGKINTLAEAAACALKYVIRHCEADLNDGLPAHALDMPNRPARPAPGLFDGTVYIQPLDSKNEAENHRNTAEAVRSSLAYGYILQLQVHKYIGVE